jgi:poly(A) polymerase
MPRARLLCPQTEAPWACGIRLVRLLRDGGHQAFLVGGCVRDLLLGRPVKDADIATSAEPQEVERLSALAGLTSVPVGRSFGVVVAVCDGSGYEVASFRRDGDSQDGRHPQAIAYTTSAEEDVARRDFTINALLYDPIVHEVIDYAGGLADLESRHLRTVGDPLRRFSEDRLRVLRALRFAAQLELSIDPATWTALRATPLTGLSNERLMQEWFKGLAGPHRGGWLTLLRSSGHLAELCPPLQTLDGAALDQLVALNEALGQASPALCAAAWLLPCPESGLAWLQTRPLPSERIKRIRWLVDQARQAEQLADGPKPALRRMLQHAAAAELVQLLCADPRQSALGERLLQGLRQEQALGAFQPLLRAQDLIDLGCAPSARLGRLLHRLEDAQLAGDITTRDQGLALAARLVAEPQA